MLRATLIALAALAVSCSLGSVDESRCESDSECRLAFGVGSVCGAGGLCELAAPHPRCSREAGQPTGEGTPGTVPDDYFRRLDSYRDAFVLGTIVDASVATHQARANSVILAAQELNDAGGFDGRQVVVVLCTNEVDSSLDTLDREQASVAVSHYLIDTLGVPAIIGPPSSTSTSAVFEGLEGRDAVIISPSATSPSLTALEPVPATDATPGLLWRTVPSDVFQGGIIAQDMLDRGIANVSIVAKDDVYGEGLSEVFVEAFEAGGGTTMIFRFDNPSGRSTAFGLANDAAFDEMLFISSQTSDAVAVLRSADIAGLDVPILFLPDSATNQDFIDDASSTALFPNIRGTRPAPVAGPIFDAFILSYAALHGDDAEDFTFTAHAYDAAWLALYGAHWAVRQEESVTGRSIARGMRRLSSGAAFDVGTGSLPDVLSAFDAGEGVNLVGASGTLDFDPSTEETVGPIEVVVINAGGTSFVPEYRVDP